MYNINLSLYICAFLTILNRGKKHEATFTFYPVFIAKC